MKLENLRKTTLNMIVKHVLPKDVAGVLAAAYGGTLPQKALHTCQPQLNILKVIWVEKPKHGLASQQEFYLSSPQLANRH
jgi:hypothetical protein